MTRGEDKALYWVLCLYDLQEDPSEKSELRTDSIFTEKDVILNTEETR